MVQLYKDINLVAIHVYRVPPGWWFQIFFDEQKPILALFEMIQTEEHILGGGLSGLQREPSEFLFIVHISGKNKT